MSSGLQELFRVLDSDKTVYGPVDLDVLIQWAQEKRLLAETLVHVESEGQWHQAQDYAPLQRYFSSPEKSVSKAAHLDQTVDISSEELRQFPIFSDLSYKQLQHLVTLGYSFEVAPGKLVVKQGEPCDAIYFVLSGTLRVRLLTGPKNDIALRRISGGEFFGEVGMFLQSTRMADVIAETRTRLLRISSSAFQKLVKETPELSAPLLFSLAVTMAKHMAEDHQRFSRGATSEFLWR